MNRILQADVILTLSTAQAEVLGLVLEGQWPAEAEALVDSLREQALKQGVLL